LFFHIFYLIDLSRNYSPRKIVNVSATFYYDSNVFWCFFRGFRGILHHFCIKTQLRLRSNLLNDEEVLNKIKEYIYKKYEDGEIPFFDELYYAYILWNERKKLPKENLPKIREFLTSAIKNAETCIKTTEPRDVSKIYKAIYLDLVNNFEQTTILVLKEEL
jgi:hypothetical protein